MSPVEKCTIDYNFLAYFEPKINSKKYLKRPQKKNSKSDTGSSRLMRISLLRISLLRFFKTITKIWLMRFYGLFILLLRT